MSIPGANLYKLATRLIKPQPILFYKYKGRGLDKQRNWVAMYEDPVHMTASVQAIERNQYIEMGLEWQKNYVKIWAPLDMTDIDRNSSGDLFKFGNRWFKLEDETPWFVQDGWASCLAVEIKQSFPIQGSVPIIQDRPQDD